MLDFRIDTFLAVCKTMNYTRAAEELSLTQPAVSQHIHYLEADYGVRLFEIQGKKLFLTEAGCLLRDAAVTMHHDAVRLRDELSGLNGLHRLLRLGATLTVGEYVLPGPLALFMKRYPDTQLHMTVNNTSELLRLLNEGEIDVAIVEGFFPKNEYESREYSKERFVAVCAPDYSYRGTVRQVEHLLRERLLVRETGSGTREVLEKYLQSRNLTVQDFVHQAEISNLSTIKALACAGCGIAFLYEAAVREELKSGRLREIPLEEFQIHHELSFLWRRGSIYAQEYEQLFKELCPKDSN